MIVRQLRNQKGQSLLELLVALLILVIALTATISLIVHSINAGRESRNKLIGTSLAREGIEIVRNIRDSNWIDPTTPSWDDGLTGATAEATPLVGIPGMATMLYFDGGGNAAVKLYSDSYTQGASAPGTSSQFSRTLFLNNICQYQNVSSPNDPLNGTEQIVGKTQVADCDSFGVNYVKVGIRIISEVSWSGNLTNRIVRVEDRLYNWQTF